MRLLITIPALDEEESIREIIEHTLEARQHIVESSPVTAVDVTVVSDGSTDRTVEIASEYADDVHLIVFEENRGYGAAITEAWRQSDAELLSFLDADGTCDPRFFADLCTVLVERDADIALGCRLHSKSHMPLLRRIGNLGFAAMLSVLSMTRVRDSASGMRVVRRSCLALLFPLPSSLDFTPAMSARAVLSRDVSITEIDMPYSERAGESKLHPLRDGWRFLSVILQTTFLYRPGRPLGLAALLLVAFTTVMMAHPTWYWLENRRLEEWMIYRFLVGVLFASTAVLLICVSHLARKAADISLSNRPREDKYSSTLGKLFRPRWFWLVPALCVVVGVELVWDAWRAYLETGEVYEHWSRFVVMMFLLSVSATLVATKFLDYCLNLLADRLAYLREDR
jgi:glycosyltransferase involved in cell wall biosynthesis